MSRLLTAKKSALATRGEVNFQVSPSRTSSIFSSPLWPRRVTVMRVISSCRKTRSRSPARALCSLVVGLSRSTR
ncbi:MAG: hypothetical protein HYV09_14280 [Deltaproteobacteria bacterium]|nr:hypothetical protein [Deltaproteobacteria bacterium]